MAASNTPLHVVYVMGVGRSGSTLLDIALGSHPRVESVGELKNLVRGGWRENGYCACGSRVQECDFWARVDGLWRRQVEGVDLDAMAADMLDLLLLRKHRSWPAMVADGVCSRGAGEAKAAYAALSGNSVMAVGGWDTAGGDSNATFSVFRAAKKAAGGTGDPSGIAACCAALSQNANSAPPTQKGAYLAAAGACNALRNNPQGKAALAGVRAMLAGASVPAVCR